MDGAVIMKSEDQRALEVLYKVRSGQMSRKQACQTLEVSLRTLERYLKDYQENGLLALRHGNAKRAPVNKLPDSFKLTVQQLVRDKYFDFNMLHCLEKIREETGIEIKRETFRKWMQEIQLVKRSHKRRSRPRFRRERKSQPGILLMIDGSHHVWFADVECCLIAVIDDATGEVPFAEFFHGETTLGCLKVLRKIVEKKGAFCVLYADKAGLYGGSKRQDFCQVSRALEELGTQTLYAHSPEAKGRIERLFQTLQDRLIPEMRLKGIKTMKEANEYLQNVFLPHHYHPRFVVQAHNPTPAYRPLHAATDLDAIFCVKEYRQVGRDHTISLEGEKYLIDERLRYSIHGQKIELRKWESGPWKAYFAGKPVQLLPIKKVPKLGAA